MSHARRSNIRVPPLFLFIHKDSRIPVLKSPAAMMFKLHSASPWIRVWGSWAVPGVPGIHTQPLRLSCVRDMRCKKEEVQGVRACSTLYSNSSGLQRVASRRCCCCCRRRRMRRRRRRRRSGRWNASAFSNGTSIMIASAGPR